ncbi:hypothetical protein ACLOJK_023047 [Asimina triloba]
MSEEEHWKIIVTGKRPEESSTAPITKEVLRPDASFPLTWEYLEESLAGIVSEARHMVGEELRRLRDYKRSSRCLG